MLRHRRGATATGQARTRCQIDGAYLRMIGAACGESPRYFGLASIAACHRGCKPSLSSREQSMDLIGQPSRIKAEKTRKLLHASSPYNSIQGFVAIYQREVEAPSERDLDLDTPMIARRSGSKSIINALSAFINHWISTWSKLIMREINSGPGVGQGACSARRRPIRCRRIRFTSAHAAS